MLPQDQKLFQLLLCEVFLIETQVRANLSVKLDVTL
jgi:hypothetical protein